MIRLVIIAISLFVAGLCRADNTNFEKLGPIVLDLLVIQGPQCGVPDSEEAEPYKAQLRAGLTTIAEPGLIDKHDMSPVDYAVLADDVGALKRLSGLGYQLTTASSGGSLLVAAVQFSSTEVVTFLLDSGLDPNGPASSGISPLMQAALENRPQMVRLLLKRGAMVNLQTSNGNTALHLAFACTNPVVIQLLLNAGAEVDDRAIELARKDGLDSLLEMKANKRPNEDAQEVRTP